METVERVNQGEVISFDAEKLKAFKKAYEPHAKSPDTVFVFEEKEYLSSYAKYLIEYLEANLQ